MNVRARDDSFDNIRFLLIVCVVFAHLLEVCAPFRGSGHLYRLIYSFHMPAFLFLFGYFARYKPERILFGWVIPYAVFQTAYICFARYILGIDAALQYTTPYWLLWYMMVCIFYQLLLPLYETDSVRKQAVTLLVVFALSVLAGFDSSVGYYASLSRFFVFQPFFVLGHYWAGHAQRRESRPQTRGTLWRNIGICACVCISVAGLVAFGIPETTMYGSYPYSALGYSPWTRIFNGVMAVSWIAFLMCIVRPLLSRKIPVCTAIGQNTLSVFLLHGFIVKAVPVYAPELVSTPARVVLLTCAIVLGLGNPLVGRCMRWLCSDRWLKKITCRRGGNE